MKTLIIGMGATGAAVAAFLKARGRPFDVFDDRKGAAALDPELTGTACFNDPAAVDLTAYGECVTSPGIAWRHPLLAKARELGAAVISEIELAYRHARGPIIAVTGSNGKSTTVSLIHWLLQAAGRNVSLCGNIGDPFIGCVDDDPERIYVLEVSSFQLEHVRDFRPRVGALLNISPDHLDRHGDFETYAAAKLRLFARQTAEDLALAPAEWLQRLPGAARRCAIPGPAARLEADAVALEGGFRASLADFPLLGEHNRSNALFACAAAAAFGVEGAAASTALAEFRGLEHRMERVGEADGRLWINDSKATNCHAAQAAIDGMDRPYALIMGGSDKGERFTALDFSARPPQAIVAYGETAPKIRQDLAAREPVHEPDFRQACLAAHRLAPPHGAVLLAPACASFDQFPNFKARGAAFKQLFQEVASS